MKLWIPKIKDQIRLTEDWEFPLFRERRNDSMTTRIKPTLGLAIGNQRVEESIGCCLLSGTVLQIDRVYIRSGSSSAWDSITFYVKFSPGDKDKPRHIKQLQRWSRCEYTPVVVDPEPQKLKGARFWAKLSSVNEVVCDIISEEDRIR